MQKHKFTVVTQLHEKNNRDIIEYVESSCSDYARAVRETLLIQAKAEAEANQVLANSVTENLIKMKEAEARLKHGWVEVQSNGSVITNH